MHGIDQRIGGEVASRFRGDHVGVRSVGDGAGFVRPDLGDDERVRRRRFAGGREGTAGPVVEPE
jgi:hypothetical protein